MLATIYSESGRIRVQLSTQFAHVHPDVNLNTAFVCAREVIRCSAEMSLFIAASCKQGERIMRGSFKLIGGSESDQDYALKDMVTLFEDWGYEVKYG